MSEPVSATTFEAYAWAASSRWRTLVWPPLDAWSWRRRLLSALLIAMATAGLGVRSLIIADPLATRSANAALDETQRRAASAQLALADLPKLRRNAALSSRRHFAARGPTIDIKYVAQLATRYGVVIVALEPDAASAARQDPIRRLRFAGRSGFAGLTGFLRGLAALPVLVVPEDVTISRDGGALAMNALLRVFDDLSPPTRAADDAVPMDFDASAVADILVDDPFSLHPGTEEDLTDAGALRLVGVLTDRSHGLALIQTAQGAVAVGPGQLLEDERVTRVDAHGVTLAGRTGARTLVLTESPK